MDISIALLQSEKDISDALFSVGFQEAAEIRDIGDAFVDSVAKSVDYPYHYKDTGNKYLEFFEKDDAAIRNYNPMPYLKAANDGNPEFIRLMRIVRRYPADSHAIEDGRFDRAYQSLRKMSKDPYRILSSYRALVDAFTEDR